MGKKETKSLKPNDKSKKCRKRMKTERNKKKCTAEKEEKDCWLIYFNGMSTCLELFYA